MNNSCCQIQDPACPDETGNRNVTAGDEAAARPLNLWPLAFLAWVVCLITGYALSVHEQTQPAPAGRSPSQWPAAAGMRGPEERPVLVMFVHPRCPCSRASLKELANVLQLRPGVADARVVVLSDPRISAQGGDNFVTRQAGAISGLTVLQDEAGHLARRFGAATSGYTLLYDAAGRLRFAGGVTAGRGHCGPNSGVDQLLARLSDQSAASTSTPIFGCPLFSDAIGVPTP